MKYIKHLLIFICLIAFVAAHAQVQITPKVVSTAGSYSTGGNMSLSATVGEPAVITLVGSGIILTQGFQQPTVLNTLNLNTIITVYNASCTNVNDGYAVAEVSDGTLPYIYQWYNDVGTIVGSTLMGGMVDTSTLLLPGIYTVLVIDADGNTGLDTAIILSDNVAGCELHVFSGITPNSDGHNDSWLIEGIENFPDNQVSIFNRWGNTVWEGTNYNNIDVIWDGKHRNGSDLLDGTYYYVISIVDGDTYKGWVQVSR